MQAVDLLRSIQDVYFQQQIEYLFFFIIKFFSLLLIPIYLCTTSKQAVYHHYRIKSQQKLMRTKTKYNKIR